MGVFDFLKKESRNLEDPTSPVSAADFLQVMGWADTASAAGVIVTIDNALGVPAVWSAVNFLAGTLAGLPINVYRKTDKGREKVENGVAPILNDVANDQQSAFEVLKYSFEQVFTGGRAVIYIERTRNGRVANLWPLDPGLVRVERVGGRRVYRDGSRAYTASEVIDLPFMLKSNGLDARGPIMTNKDAIGLAISSAEYGSKSFQSGGIPPVVLEGPFSSGDVAARASADVAKAMAKLRAEGRPILAMPTGHQLKPLGLDPEKMQLIELQRFCVEQVARIYSLPPVFLQDLTHGTFSNTEQQDLHFVKHTVKRWVEQAEAEINLKIFGRVSRLYAEFNVDGLLRGDFKTRMDAHAVTIQNGIRSPNEVRDIENMAPRDEGEGLMIQGATVPIATQGELTEAERSAIELNQVAMRSLNGEP